MFKLYSNMKAKQKTNHLNFIHWSTMYGIITSMFKYTNLEDTNLDELYIERYLNSEGMIVIGKVNDKLTAMVGTRNDDLNTYGQGMKVNATTQNGKSFQGTIGKDCVVIFNNNMYLPELDINFYSDILTEIDKSIELNIQYTRDYPIPIVNNDKEREIVRTAIKNMRDGVASTIVGSQTLNQLINDDTNKTLELSTPERIHNLQYLLQAYETIEKRFWQRYGHNISTTGKQAQVTETELTGTDSVSQVYPQIKLLQRKKGIEELNKVFGTNITVDFSEIWKSEEKNYFNNNESEVEENGIEDDRNDKSSSEQ